MTRREIWIDVGAHLGEKTFEAARMNPNLLVYAFEPNLKLAAQRFGMLENFVVIPMAVSERDGFSQFFLNKFDAASSLLDFNPEGLRKWVGNEELLVEKVILVPTIRLETFMNCMSIESVDFLKIDAQGADFQVVLSAGERLKDIHKITMEVAVTPIQLYAGAAQKKDVIDFMSKRGFVLTEVENQTHGQEENLTFVRKLT